MGTTETTDEKKVVPFRRKEELGSPPLDSLPEPADDHERRLIDMFRKTEDELRSEKEETARLEHEVARMADHLRLVTAKVAAAAPGRMESLEGRIRELERQLRTAPDLQAETEEMLQRSAQLRRGLALIDPAAWKPNDTQFALVMGSLAQTREAIERFAAAAGGDLP
ncbi:MAG: hypothetical protein KIT79_12720 [Deltaproteobacteria bacterium]|nr:hypothetical protein [Deltaproteobacteria bacterium]